MSVQDSRGETPRPIAHAVDVSLPLETLRDAADGAATCSARDIERLTGVSQERLRTWERRHGFPTVVPVPNGRRGILLSDLPRVLAVRQLIAGGQPVAEAIAQVQAGELPAPDFSVLNETFEQLATPVVVLSGPEPLTVEWANHAARELATDDAPIRAPHPSHPAYQAVQRILAEPDGKARTLPLPGWTDPDGEPLKALAWTIGAPAFTPAAVVIVELPADDGGDPHEPEPMAEPDVDRQLLTAIARARRAMQRGAGAAAVHEALTSIVDGVGADDGFIAHAHGRELRTGPTARGARRTPVIARQGDSGWDAARQGLRPVWITGATCELLGTPDRACLAIALLADTRELGFAVLEFADPPALPDVTQELLQSFGSAAGASLARDHAVAHRRDVLS